MSGNWGYYAFPNSNDLWNPGRLAQENVAWVLGAKAAPTAVNGAAFALIKTNHQPVLLDITMSTDTPMGFNIYPANSDPGLANSMVGQDMNGGVGAVNVSGEWAVGAAPASPHAPFYYGRIPVNTTQSIWSMQAAWWFAFFGVVIVYTDAVAGNVTCNFIGCAFN